MRHRHLFAVMLVIAISIPLAGWAQALFDPSNIVYEPSRLFPIVPENEIDGAADAPISKGVINKIYDRCLSRMPARFTPEAHRYYCACSAASTQGSMTVQELKDLQKDKNRKLGNKAFEKYVHNVMKPCLDMPVEDTEYMYCVMYRKNDWRIQLPLPYCKCVSSAIRKHFEEFGEEEMMIPWGNTNMTYEDPVDAIWGSDKFLKARQDARDSCAGAYMNPRYFK